MADLSSSPVTIEFDGGSRGNPGPAGVGVVLRSADGTAIVTLGRFIGVATNNTAEYLALIIGLEQAHQIGAKQLRIRGDSELIIKQMRGEYRVKHPELKKLYDRAQALLVHFDQVELGHNLRHKNELADKLANRAMDRRGEVTEIDEIPTPPTPSATSEESPKGTKLACVRCGCAIEVISASTLRPHQLKPFTCQCGAKLNRVEKDPR